MYGFITYDTCSVNKQGSGQLCAGFSRVNAHEIHAVPPAGAIVAPEQPSARDAGRHPRRPATAASQASGSVSRSGSQRASLQASTRPSGSTTCVTRMRRGCLPAVRTCKSSRNGSVTATSRQRRSTCTRCPRRTRRRLPRWLASALGRSHELCSKHYRPSSSRALTVRVLAQRTASRALRAGTTMRP